MIDIATHSTSFKFKLRCFCFTIHNFMLQGQHTTCASRVESACRVMAHIGMACLPINFYFRFSRSRGDPHDFRIQDIKALLASSPHEITLSMQSRLWFLFPEFLMNMECCPASVSLGQNLAHQSALYESRYATLEGVKCTPEPYPRG